MGLRDALDRRRARNRLVSGRVALIHSPAYGAPPVGGRALHDGQRGARALRRLLADGLVQKELVSRPAPASWEELGLFHGAAYLEDCWRPERLAPIFGALPAELPVDALLDAARAAVGGTLLGARLVQAGAQVAVALGGGFHHAEPDQGGGYCVFNDVGVAIRALRASGDRAPVAVVDLDVHHGNGTARGFEADESVLTISFHRRALAEVHKRANLEVELPAGMADADYLAKLQQLLRPALEAHRARIVFYVAGADVVRGDAIGDLGLSEIGAAERDAMVLRAAAGCGAKVVATLGGGYGEHAWRCAYRLARLALTDRVYSGEVIDPGYALLQGAARELRGHELSAVDAEESWGLSEDELFTQLGPHRHGGTLFLGYYSRTGLSRAFEHLGLNAKLRRRGFSDLRVALDLSDKARQELRVFGRKDGAEHCLVEIIAGLREEPWPQGKPLLLLSLEWLSLQDPTEQFAADRPQLPLQRHPGLGIAWDVVALLRLACERLGLDGVAQNAAHYHVAVFQSRDAFFVDPVREGRFRALRRALSDLRLAEATRLVERGDVLELPSLQPVRWEGAPQWLPVSARLKEHLASPSYLAAVGQAEQAAAYRLKESA